MNALLNAGREIERELCSLYDIPFIEIEPKERLRSLLAFRNDRFLFRRKCDVSGKSIISAYRPDCGFKIVTSDIWWGAHGRVSILAQKLNLALYFFRNFINSRNKFYEKALLLLELKIVILIATLEIQKIAISRI